MCIIILSCISSTLFFLEFCLLGLGSIKNTQCNLTKFFAHIFAEERLRKVGRAGILTECSLPVVKVCSWRQAGLDPVGSQPRKN